MNSPHTHPGRARRSRIALALATGAAALLIVLPTAGATGSTPSTKATAKTAAVSFPHAFSLTNAKIGHWAVVVKNVAVHAKPTLGSHVVTTLGMVTGDGTQNLVLILGGINVTKSKTWYQVRLAILPNNSTGWVPSTALGDLYVVHTHLYVNREAHTATLKKDGRVIFTTSVGNGLSPNITPAGQYYVRDKLTGYNDPVYGPLAFGTSARSVTLIDSWPGGAYVGIHGTNEPQLIPGYISHGCIRLHDDAIVKLGKLMTVGTPVTIT
ncbi:MAG TPA: L,D-transpeptidase [Gaiellaceae bacterium]|jgi:lipoprotein-anchoring transpeptidase ErfK/SrfK